MNWKAGPWKVVIGAMLLIALCTAVFMVSTDSRSNKLRADLRARGFKLTLGELAAGRQGPTSDPQEFVSIARQLERMNLPQLGGDSSLRNLSRSAKPIPCIKADKPFWASSDTNLAKWSWEDLAQASSQAQPALRRIRTLVYQHLREDGLGPTIAVWDSLFVARSLVVDAINALRQGARERALEDLEILLDFARIGSAEKDHCAQISRAAVIHTAVELSWEILHSADWSEPELRRMESAWAKVLALRTVEPAAEFDIASVADYETDLRKQLAKAPLAERVAALVGFVDEGDDVCFSIEMPLACWEMAKALDQGQNWKVIKPGLEALKSRGDRDRRSRYRHLALRHTLQPIDVLLEDSAKNEAARQLIMTDIAIRKFGLHHNGALPKNLTQLTPEYRGPGSGYDVFGGGALKYRANPDGSYLLYSVGIDGVDGGGDTSVSPGNRPFWESPDMVWPY